MVQFSFRHVCRTHRAKVRSRKSTTRLDLDQGCQRQGRKAQPRIQTPNLLELPLSCWRILLAGLVAAPPHHLQRTQQANATHPGLKELATEMPQGCGCIYSCATSHTQDRRPCHIVEVWTNIRRLTLSRPLRRQQNHNAAQTRLTSVAAISIAGDDANSMMYVFASIKNNNRGTEKDLVRQMPSGKLCHTGVLQSNPYRVPKGDP